MKLAVVGSRDFPHLWMVNRYLNEFPHSIGPLTTQYYFEIVSGGARGVDLESEQWALHWEIPRKIFLPDWDLWGRSAGFKRNAQIVDYCDELVAFQYKGSKGTQHSIDLAKKSGKLREVINVY